MVVEIDDNPLETIPKKPLHTTSLGLQRMAFVQQH